MRIICQRYGWGVCNYKLSWAVWEFVATNYTGGEGERVAVNSAKGAPWVRTCQTVCVLCDLCCVCVAIPTSRTKTGFFINYPIIQYDK